MGHQYFYPRSPCGERRVYIRPLRFLFYISIHALLAESDSFVARSAWIVPYFYPRSPCGERRINARYTKRAVAFLSTLSLRRATSWPRGMIPLSLYFYPRSPCGERHAPSHSLYPSNRNFYPRSPCGERPPITLRHCTTYLFLSTLSLRRATAKVHKTVGHFCAYETNFMEIASSC